MFWSKNHATFDSAEQEKTEKLRSQFKPTENFSSHQANALKLSQNRKLKNSENVCWQIILNSDFNFCLLISLDIQCVHTTKKLKVLKGRCRVELEIVDRLELSNFWTSALQCKGALSRILRMKTEICKNQWTWYGFNVYLWGTSAWGCNVSTYFFPVL